MEKYELDRATRPFEKFVDDLSTWYLRRSRDRFKSENAKEKADALSTVQYVLLTFSKILAPFTPFMAEDIYRRVGGERESVHLETWPKVQKSFKEIFFFSRKDLFSPMEETRALVSLALEARSKSGIKVRQPLSTLTIKSEKLKDKEEYLALLRDEVNVKEIRFDKNLTELVLLNADISPELKVEGAVRDLVRAIQEMRKEARLVPTDIIKLEIYTEKENQKIIINFEAEILKMVGAGSLKKSDTDFSAEKISTSCGDFKVRFLI
jgi:isoleucyl-tRNA synthetase